MSLIFICFLTDCIHINSTNVGEKSNNTHSNKDKINKKVIALDADHQSKGDLSKEPIGPGSSQSNVSLFID